MKARSLMTTPAVTVQPAATLKEAARLMTDHHVSALPVVDRSGELVGIVSEADLLCFETSSDPRAQLIPVPAGRALTPATVGEVMTADVLSCDEDTDVGLVAQRMLEAHVKRLPVLRGRRVVGIVSRHDLVRVMAEEDGTIREAVRRRLCSEGTPLSLLAVEVQDGVVELSGRSDATSLKLAESVAREVPGVLDVRRRPLPK